MLSSNTARQIMQDQTSRYACVRIHGTGSTLTPFAINLVHCSLRAKLWILGRSRIIPPCHPRLAYTRTIARTSTVEAKSDADSVVQKLEETAPLPIDANAGEE